MPRVNAVSEADVFKVVKTGKSRSEILFFEIS